MESSSEEPRNIFRVAPTVVRAFEAGDKALEILAFGSRTKTRARRRLVERRRAFGAS
jgi:hypothetical protein